MQDSLLKVVPQGLIMFSFGAVAALAALMTRSTIASPLMDTLLTISALSTYAHVYNMTGGIVEINPMFTKRFNNDEDKRNYTFLAPTNEVSLFTDLTHRQ